MYKIVSLGKTLSLRQNHNVESPKIGEMKPGEYAIGDTIYEVVAPTATAKVGDRWLHLVKINEWSVDGWMAITHLGVPYCTLSFLPDEIPVPLPTPIKVVKAVVYFGDGRTETLVPEVK